MSLVNVTQFGSNTSYDQLQQLNEAVASGSITRSQILGEIPSQQNASLHPLATLRALLSVIEGPWPVLELQQAYTAAWKQLPEQAKCDNASTDVQQQVEQTLSQCKKSYSSLLDLLHSSSDVPALLDPDTDQSISHRNLTTAVHQYHRQLSGVSDTSDSVVAISLPNGPLLAMTVFATSLYWTAAPIAHGSGVGAEQFKSDVLQSKATIVVARAEDVQRLNLRGSWTTEAGITIVLAELDDGMQLVLRDLAGTRLSDHSNAPKRRPNIADDTGILLFTSGTSGTKKLVPVNVHSIVCGVAMVVESWGLSPSMRCLNQMPLHHVGGLVRNLFSPIFSGGSVICCGAFDGNQFWDCIEAYDPTWYYASPSMHQAILEAGRGRPESLEKSRIRLICNAAGGLLPSLAQELQRTFSTKDSFCIVLPSYGMTECMPISTPPLDYRLEKTGTSGVSVGPELSIRNGNMEPQTEGIGRICVRGPPLFSGYLKADGVMDKSCFNNGGWFDTGDLGHMDDDGYLYITGRSKEVINRGGELISPMEVEEAIMTAAADPKSPTYERINKVLAFAVMHDTLEEVIGVAIVTPAHQKRPCLRQIHESVKPLLSSVKIPVLVVYMDEGVPTNNNKVLRIKLASRLGLPQLTDDVPAEERHYVATCPPPNTALTVPIDCDVLRVSHEQLKAHCIAVHDGDIEAHVLSRKNSLYPELVLAPTPSSSGSRSRMPSKESLIEDLTRLLHSYELPSKIHTLEEPLSRDEDGLLDEKEIEAVVREMSVGDIEADFSLTESAIATIFTEILNVPFGSLSSASDFFDCGGDSLKAGRLLFGIRQSFKVKLPIEELFGNSQISALAALVDERRGAIKNDGANGGQQAQTFLPGCERTCSSINPFLMMLQLVPICLIYPMKRALTWTVFCYCLVYSQSLATNDEMFGRLLDLVVSMAIGRSVTICVAPMVAIAFKWLVIGRFRAGIYPMWSFYHTRWWMVQKVISIAGKGVFGVSNWTRVLYFRLLGVKIGRNVTLTQGATLGEYDLIRIEDDVVLERCIVRPFGAEANTSMYLGPISLGQGSSVGLGAIVAPGTSLPPNTCLGPNSSSWEASDADEANRLLAASKIEGAHWLLILLLGLPIQIFVRGMGGFPWAAALLALVRHPPTSGLKNTFREVLVWFSSPDRVALHYAALAANAWLGPIFVFVAVYAWKKVLGGRIRPEDYSGGQPRSHWVKFRMYLSRALMPTPRFHKLTELFGTHYGPTSVFARALGAKVGKRVYWPGTGPSWQDIDLIDIGDDVVFGSRSHIVTSDGNGCAPVRISDRAMIADRVTLLPGVNIGKQTVMGSGALTRRDHHYPDETTWVGSKKGEAVCLSGKQVSTLGFAQPNKPEAEWSSEKKDQDVEVLPVNSSSNSSKSAGSIWSSSASTKSASQDEKITPKVSSDLKRSSADVVDEKPSTPAEGSVESSPFGRAFYMGLASYRVWSQFEITLYSTLVTIITAIFWNVGSISATQIAGRLFRSGSYIAPLLFAKTWYRPLTVYTFFLTVIFGIMTLQTLSVLLFLIAAKWILIGRRQQGNYDWDKSPYCQRWQLFLKLEALRRNCYGGNGILGLLTGTHWIVMYFRALGANIGKDCALFAGGLPSLYFTEPELLTLGDRVTVDDASLVCHINTRGKFDLNPLYVGDRSVLRSGSRLLSGARMEADSCLLEHTLVMAGDIVDAGCTQQGWPAADFTSDRAPTLREGRMISVSV